MNYGTPRKNRRRAGIRVSKATPDGRMLPGRYPPSASDGTPGMQKIAPQLLRATSNSVRVGRFLNLDGLHPRHLPLLEDHQLQIVADFLMLVEALGKLPDEILDVAGALAEQLKGERPRTGS